MLIGDFLSIDWDLRVSTPFEFLVFFFLGIVIVLTTSTKVKYRSFDGRMTLIFWTSLAAFISRAVFDYPFIYYLITGSLQSLPLIGDILMALLRALPGALLVGILSVLIAKRLNFRGGTSLCSETDSYNGENSIDPKHERELQLKEDKRIQEMYDDKEPSTPGWVEHGFGLTGIAEAVFRRDDKDDW